MKIYSPADSLWPLVRRMGTHRSEFLLRGAGRSVLPEFIEGLNDGGQDIALGDVETVGGLLSSQGAQIVLYIPDQGSKIEEVLAKGSEGKRVHIADCLTLEQMRQRNRFQRYRAVVNVSGDFEVYGVSYSSRQPLEGQARLRVCINCLKHLNYKGYLTEPKNQTAIINHFDLRDFFGSYSSLFRYLPKAFTEHKPGYSDDWAEISRQYRQAKNYICEQCDLNLGAHQRILHVHHRNGNKRDNERSNLMALCADCHRKQPLHDYMYISSRDMALIQKLRRDQALISDNTTWNAAFGLVDSAFEGLLRLYQAKGRDKPEIGFELADSNHMVIAEAELAWPRLKRAVVRNSEEKRLFESHGWQTKDLAEALLELR